MATLSVKAANDQDFNIAKKVSSDQTNTSGNETMLDDIVDVTEDDLPDAKDSDTDSDSYWSPVDESEELVNASSSFMVHATDECMTEDIIHTAVLKTVDSVSERGEKMIVPDSENALLEGGKVQPNYIEEGLDGSPDAESLVPDKSVKASKNFDEESCDTFGGEITKTEMQTVGSECKGDLGVIDEGKETSSEDETSTFQNYHKSYAENLLKKTRVNSEFSNDSVDAVVRSMSKRKPAMSIEKCLGGYDIVDQFDVKVSQRTEFVNPPDSVNLIGKLQAVAIGIRRSMSFRKPKVQNDEFEIRERSRRTKSDTWAFKRNPIDDFVNLNYHKREEKDGEVVEVIVVSPKSKRKKDTNRNNSTIDEVVMDGRGKDIGKGSVAYDDVDIGSARDVIDSPASCKHPLVLADDVDVISLSGFEDKTTISENEVETNKEEPSKDISDAINKPQPVRPPRRKQKSSAFQSSPMKRGSSESELYQSIGAGLLGIDQGNRLKSTSTYDFKAVGSENASKRNSEDNIFKSFLPFLDEKKKTLSGQSSKTLPADKEKLYLFTDAFPTQIPDFPQDKRSLIANEIFTTERTFVRGLELLVQLFKKKALQLGQLDSKEADIVFSNVNEILDFNKGILDEVYQRLSNWSDDQIIGDIFFNHASKFKVYAKYCQNYDASEEFVKYRMKKKKEFEAFIQSCLCNPSCQIGLSLPSYLITVVQRTPRYILLLKDLLKKTSSSHPDYENLGKAVKAMEEVATYINNQLKLSQSEKALAALQQQIIGLKAYYFSGRTLVHEGPVCLMNIKRTYQCVLFNDLLVFASKGESKQSEVDLVLDLRVVWFQDLEDLDPQTTKEDAIGLYTPDRPYTIYVGANAAKKLWLQHLRSAVLAHNFDGVATQGSEISKRKASHTYKNGSVYSGEFLESKREGEGTMMWPNQMTYRGNWIDDERNGEGTLEYGTGEVYEGEFKDDKLHGYGCCRYSNGDKYSGRFKAGVRHGEAKLEFENGDVFEGTFENDRIDGQGKLICKNGMEYNGSWKRNMRSGFGILKMSNGDVYEGNFKNDSFNGEGILRYSTGAIYQGKFVDGQRCGEGTYSDSDGTSYKGSWLDDLKDGTGSLTYPNGDTFEGCFVEGQKCGMGKMTYSDGRCYNGQWKHDHINGFGVMEFKDGSKYDGNWVSMQRCGQGKQVYANGSVYQGEWEYDMPSGKGTLEFPSAMKYKGEWLRGKRHGNGTLSDPSNSYKYQGGWKNDRKEGKGIEMIYGVLYEGTFKNDMRSGHGIETAHDTTTFEGNWRFGQKHGKGSKRLLNGMVQRQYWHMGSLIECPVLVPREVPPVKRS